MEALSLAPRRLSGGDMLTALAGSILAHIFILFTALFLPELMPRQSYQVPFYTVNLVSMDELKGPAVPPLKGTKSAPAPSKPAQESKSAAKTTADTQRKAAPPVAPVKRLELDDTPRKPATELKKLETSELPKIAARTDSAGAVEKDLEKLTRKPKTSPPPPPEPAQQASSSTREESSGPDTPAPGRPTEGTQTTETAGVPEGSPSGSTQAGAGGGQVGFARRLYYTEIWNAVRSQWALPDPSKYRGLEAVLVLAVRRDGKVLDIRFEKRSGNALFDESAEKAVRKADPLPPFPAIYSVAQEEIGLRFRPEDL